MAERTDSSPPSSDTVALSRPPVRWWPPLVIFVLAVLTIFYFRVIREDSQQWRNLYTMETWVVATILLLLWALFWSRLRRKIRWILFGSVVGFIGLMAAMFEIHGVSGDLVPILRFRWTRSPPLAASSPSGSSPKTSSASVPGAAAMLTNSFPQFLGPHRNATLPEGPTLERDWTAQPPGKLWRQRIGAGWSGFAVVGDRVVTLEQRGEEESVVCYELLTGKELWSHADKARYYTMLAGEGPRTTPCIAGDKVVTLGSTGMLNCLDLATGNVIWGKNIITENLSRVPEWGVAGSPLVLGDLVIVNPGGKNGRSLVAYRLSTGEFVWGAAMTTPVTVRLAPRRLAACRRF